MSFSLNLELEGSGGHGIVLPQLKLGLDTRFSKDFVQVISHAHADHVPYKTKLPVLATSATIDLMIARGFKGEFEKIAFFEPYKTDLFELTLFPAGHILGSAMIFIESDFGNVLYTGDFRYPASPTTEGCFFPEKPVDVFIAEATFGLPIYRWKAFSEYQNQIVRFAQDCLKKDINPIYLAYNLGKAQEVLFALASAGIPTQIHDAGFGLCSIYEQYGFDLGDYERLNPKTSKGKALVIPSSVMDSKVISGLAKTRVAYVSGWAALESRRQQMLIDERIALSDHIDFYELLGVVERLNPKKTYITHSPNPDIVCHYLQKNGFDAEPLGEIGRVEE